MEQKSLFKAEKIFLVLSNVDPGTYYPNHSDFLPALRSRRILTNPGILPYSARKIYLLCLSWQWNNQPFNLTDCVLPIALDATFYRLTKGQIHTLHL